MAYEHTRGPRTFTPKMRAHLARLSAAKVTHGLTRSAEYSVWSSMIDRCTNCRSKDWSWYGGRGITVCERWKRFENFLADMGLRPAGATLDRIDNLQGYEPGNCRWTTIAVQARNRRSNVLYEYAGRKLTLSQWADECGINRYTFYWRFSQGWRGHRLFSRP